MCAAGSVCSPRKKQPILGVCHAWMSYETNASVRRRLTPKHEGKASSTTVGRTGWERTQPGCGRNHDRE
jgi:hypothetical protein